MLIALVLGPLVRLLVKRLKFKRWIAALLCLLLFIAVISSLGAWLVSTLVGQVRSFADNAPNHIEEIATRLDEANMWLSRFNEHLPEGWYMPSIEEAAPAIIGFFVGEGLGDTGFRAFVGIGDFFLNFVIALVSAYFFMADGKKIFEFFKNACPKWLLKQMRHTKEGLTRALGGYFRAQGILMLMVFVISVVGLFILGSPYALLLALLFAVLDFLPILGPALVLLPWALISVIMGNMRMAIGLAIMWGVITIARQVLQPKILGNQMGAHPLASLMAIFIGFRVFGLFGLIIGPVLLMIFVAIMETEGDTECTAQRSEKSE
jgi:sporulation integral membrane protein YtvI